MQKYGVTHILVEPGEPLGFDVAQAGWLKRLPNPGSLEVLEVTADVPVAAQSKRIH